MIPRRRARATLAFRIVYRLAIAKAQSWSLSCLVAGHHDLGGLVQHLSHQPVPHISRCRRRNPCTRSSGPQNLTTSIRKLRSPNQHCRYATNETCLTAPAEGRSRARLLSNCILVLNLRANISWRCRTTIHSARFCAARIPPRMWLFFVAVYACCAGPFAPD
jgi:hypothetical protein